MKKTHTILIPSLALLMLSVTNAWANSIEALGQKYDRQHAEYQQVLSQQQKLKVDIQSSETKIQSLAEEKKSALTALEDIQRIDRENPSLQLGEKVSEAKRRNQAAYKQYDDESLKLNRLRQQWSDSDAELKHVIVSLNQTASEIQQQRDQVVAGEAEKRMLQFKRTTNVEGYAEVGCGEESPRKCQARAKRSAERNASEKGSVMVVDAATQIENFQIKEDQIKTEVQAQLTNVEVISKGWVNDTTYQYRIRADVTPILGSNLRDQIEESIANELGIVVPEMIQLDDSPRVANIQRTDAKPMSSKERALSASEKSFAEMEGRSSPENTEEVNLAAMEAGELTRTSLNPRAPVQRKPIIEPWYAMWGLGVSSNTYSDNYTEIFEILEDNGGERSTFSMDLLGFYWPISQATLVGVIASASSDTVEMPEGGQFRFLQTNTALSTMVFGSTIGKGFFFRGDIGFANAQVDIESDLLQLSERSEQGVGMVLGTGYSFAISNESRLVLGLYYGYKSIEDEELSSLAFNVSGLW